MDYKTTTASKLLKFSVSVVNTVKEESLRFSQKMSMHRDSFANLATIEKDIDRLFLHLQKKIIK